MAQELANLLEGRLTTAIWVSAVIALVIVAIVAVTWLLGRRIVRHRSPSYWGTARIHAFSRRKGPMELPGETEAPRTIGPGSVSDEAWPSRLVRDTAQRAATLRDTWDRSYRAARTSGTPGDVSGANLAAVAEELLRQQRATNELLRELLDRLEPGGKQQPRP
jgi:hypothetical protein